MRLQRHANEKLDDREKFRMMLVVILVSILAGFGARYAARAAASSARGAHSAPPSLGSPAFRQNSAPARARRAF